MYLLYSSRSGNTRRLAEGVAERLAKKEISVMLYDISDGSMPPLADLQAADLVVVAFWVDKTRADEAACEVLKRLDGVSVYLTGTLGYFADSPYGTKCLLNAVDCLPDTAKVLGGSLYQGGSDRMRRELAGEELPPRKHDLGPEAKERQLLLLDRPSEIEMDVLAERLATQRELSRRLKEQGEERLQTSALDQLKIVED